MPFTFGDKREVYLLDESAEKESMQEGKRSIGPTMKYGHTNLVHFALIKTKGFAYELESNEWNRAGHTNQSWTYFSKLQHFHYLVITK